MIERLIELFWIFLPAGISNMMPIFAMKINILNQPINEKLFGSHKTYRGFVFGIIGAIITSYFEVMFNVVNYSNYLLIGSGLGFFALFGDLIKSYFKRKVGIAPGKSWIIFDQIDWIIASLIFTNFFFYLNFIDWIIVIITGLLIHPTVNYIGYLIRIKKNKF